MISEPVAKVDPGADRYEGEPGTRRKFVIGLANAVATTAIAAMQPVITRYSALNIDPLLFSAGSVTIAAAFVAAALARSGELATLADRKYLPRLFALSMTGTVATTLSLIFALRKIDAVSAVILLESEPIYSLLLATVFLHERPSKRQLGATATIIAGIVLALAGGGAFSPPYPAALVFITPLFWQISHVLSLGIMPPLSPRCVTGARYLFAAFVLLALLFVFKPRASAELSHPQALLILSFTGIVVFALGSLSWYGAISRLSLAWTTAFVIPGVPILSFLFTMIFLGEYPSAREIAGMVIAIVGVIALLSAADTRRLESAEAVHQPLN